MKFRKYDKYKPSEIDWLPQIPNDWKIKRLKDIFNEFGSGSTPKAGNPYYYENANINWLNTSDLNNSNIYKIKYKITDLAVKDYSLKIFKENSLAMAMYGQGKTRGMVGLIQVKTTTNQASCIMQNIQKSNNVYYILWSLISQYNYIRSINTGTTQPNMNQDFIRNITLLAPNKKTQINIANYLDTKTSFIDKKISLLEKKKANYKELKQTLINEVVTKGLDKTVAKKDSKIDWIGEIPKHWKTMRLKNIFNERVQKNRQKDNEPVTKNILSVMKDIGVINHKDKGLVGNKMSEDITNYKVVHIDDIVVNKMNVMIGSVGISKEFGALSVIYIILKTKKFSSPKYYDYLFKIKRFQRNLRRISTGILEIREAVNMILFNGQNLPVPPKEEQIEIAKYLDEKTKKIDDIIKIIDKNIFTLKEFKKTLINDTVTGKIKVA